MESFAPVVLYNIEMRRILFHLFNFVLIEMRLYEVAEIRNKQNLSGCVP